MNYIDRIKQLKSEKKITNDKLSEMTGIPLGTLSKILAGFSDSPKLSNIVSICDALGSSLEYVINGTPENNNNSSLDRLELRLVENYRVLDDYGKDLIMTVAEKERERVENGNADISHKFDKHAKILNMPDISKRPTMSERGLGKRSIKIYDMPVSAGVGVFLDSPSTDEIVIPDNDRTKEADYALRISGNSMEPKYHSGDVLLVANSDSVEVGELGIFVLDGNGYFKIFGGDRLVSMNNSYGDILLKDFENISCVGRVIGKIKRK